MKQRKNKGWYCSNCGEFNEDSSVFCLYCGTKNNIAENKNIKGKKHLKGWKVALGIFVILLLIGSGVGIKIYRDGRLASSENKKNNIEIDSKKNNKVTKTKNKNIEKINDKEATTEWNASMSFSELGSEDDTENTTKSVSNTTEQLPQTKNVVLEGVAASNTGSYLAVTDLSNYKEISIDDKFTFAYPKGFFQKGSLDGENYNFETIDEKNNECVLSVQVLSNGNSVQEEYDNRINTLMDVAPNIKPNKNDSGWTYSYFSGYTNKSRGQVETDIVASDGNKTYILEVEYTETNPGEYVNEQGYMMDCIYRYCNRSGSTKSPRSYEDFINMEKE